MLYSSRASPPLETVSTEIPAAPESSPMCSIFPAVARIRNPTALAAPPWNASARPRPRDPTDPYLVIAPAPLRTVDSASAGPFVAVPKIATVGPPGV